ncbi:putative membrane protein [Pedobacter sp. UYEF25]
MSLSLVQLSEIKTFIAKRGVAFIDVQMEVLDHVATAVEERMLKSPKLTFENALAETHSNFGIFGFSVIEDSIIERMDKRYRKIFFGNFLKFLAPRYLPLTALILFGIYKTQVVFESYHPPLLAILICVAVFYLVYYFIKNRGLKLSKYLAFRTSSAYLLLFGSCAGAFNIGNYFSEKQYSSFGINLNYATTAGISVLFVLYIFAALKTLSQGLEESKKLKAEYSKLSF